MEMKSDDEKEKVIKDFSTYAALLVGSLFLYLNPDFFGYTLISYSVGMICGIIGLLGFIIELSRISDFFYQLSKEIVVSFGLLVLIIILIPFDNIFINIIVFLLILAFTYSISSNFMKTVGIILHENTTLKKFLAKAPMAILNILIFILTTMQIFQIVQIFEWNIKRKIIVVK